MNTKLKYTLKFLFGTLFILGVIALLYWLFAIYQVSNWIAILAIGLFLVLPLIKVLLSLPGEIIMLYNILRSDNPEQLERLAGDMRERDQL
ncbi:hypothetical protein [Wenzhouxiangella sp. EGI_FJ10305]|uniref:hypothetical protein n=1 Tax=Wenzhouxiangella sp. EGI_FJ10305 TaxID=3243768 RepID=UPI0035D751D8